MEILDSERQDKCSVKWKIPCVYSYARGPRVEDPGQEKDRDLEIPRRLHEISASNEDARDSKAAHSKNLGTWGVKIAFWRLKDWKGCFRWMLLG